MITIIIIVIIIIIINFTDYIRRPGPFIFQLTLFCTFLYCSCNLKLSSCAIIQNPISNSFLPFPHVPAFVKRGASVRVLWAPPPTQYSTIDLLPFLHNTSHSPKEIAYMVIENRMLWVAFMLLCIREFSDFYRCEHWTSRLSILIDENFYALSHAKKTKINAKNVWKWFVDFLVSKHVSSVVLVTITRCGREMGDYKNNSN